MSVAARQQSDRTGPVESGKASGPTPKRPSAGHSGWLVGLIWLATVVLTVLALALLVATLPVPTFGRIGSAYGQQTVLAGAGAACTLAFATVGATIVWHRRRHLVGWLFCLAGLALAIQAFAGFYATYALVTSPGSLPGGRMMGWLGSWTAVPAILLIPLFCFLLFPDGRLPGPRWRLVAWFDGLILAMITVGVSLSPGPLAVLPSVANPLAPPAMAGRLAGGILIAGVLLVPVAVAASVGSLIVRLRRARGAQRQQLKWFASSAALVAVIAIPALPSLLIAPGDWANAAAVVLVIAIISLPVSAGIAILRYRLYDLDALLNRTLVYGTLTVMLAAGYAAIVLGVGAVLGGTGMGQPLAERGGGSASSLAVAVATLAVAGMFLPARRRIQDAVDRRFNRRRYNAQRTVEAFVAQLRSQTDLDALLTELHAVVDRTMEPTQVSLWLRPPQTPASGGSLPARLLEVSDEQDVRSCRS